jgi:hypothetical protein
MLPTKQLLRNQLVQCATPCLRALGTFLALPDFLEETLEEFGVGARWQMRQQQEEEGRGRWN